MKLEEAGKTEMGEKNVVEEKEIEMEEKKVIK